MSSSTIRVLNAPVLSSSVNDEFIDPTLSNLFNPWGVEAAAVPAASRAHA